MKPPKPASDTEDQLPLSYFERYSGDASYEEAFDDLFDAEYVVDLIKVVWGAEPPFRLLDCGSANGLTLEEFAEFGIDAWGVENNAEMHARTDPDWLSRNLLGDVRELPFETHSFDFIYTTCLCYLPEDQIDHAMRELNRVCRTGVVLMGVAEDMTPEVFAEYGLIRGVRTLWTTRQWSDAMVRNGFRLAVNTPAVIEEIWRVEQDADPDDWDWYPDAESLRLCFFSKDV